MTRTTPEITAEWTYDKPDKEWSFELRHSGGRGSRFKAALVPGEDNTLRVVTTDFEVPHSRNQGIGTALMRATLALAKKYGATRTTAHVESPVALRMRQRIFGEAIEISDDEPGSPPLPITVDQAIDSLERAGAYEEDLDNRRIGWEVSSNLEDLDTSQWPLPTELNKPSL